jgi:DNA-binding transcriptional LysR family regulator
MLSALAVHDCVHFVLPSTGQSVPWLFRRDGRDIELRPRASYRCTDDYLGTVTLARQGAGLLQTYRYIVQEDLAQGGLQELLPEAGRRSRPFSLIYPNRHHAALRVRALIDFLVVELGGERRQQDLCAGTVTSFGTA